MKMSAGCKLFVKRDRLALRLEEQLGLKLERTRGLIDVLVIDSVEQPTPD